MMRKMIDFEIEIQFLDRPKTSDVGITATIFIIIQHTKSY